MGLNLVKLDLGRLTLGLTQIVSPLALLAGLAGKWCQTFNYLFFAFPVVVVITLSPWRENPEFIIPVRFTM